MRCKELKCIAIVNAFFISRKLGLERNLFTLSILFCVLRGAVVRIGFSDFDIRISHGELWTVHLVHEMPCRQRREIVIDGSNERSGLAFVDRKSGRRPRAERISQIQSGATDNQFCRGHPGKRSFLQPAKSGTTRFSSESPISGSKRMIQPPGPPRSNRYGGISSPPGKGGNIGVPWRRSRGDDKIAIDDLADHVIGDGVEVLIDSFLFCRLKHRWPPNLQRIPRMRSPTVIDLGT
jgi:hypothetical protein